MHELVVNGKMCIINLNGMSPDISELVVERIGTALF